MQLKSSYVITLLLGVIQWCNGTDLPIGFTQKLIASDLDPTVIAESPDGRIFVAEKNGNIRIIENDTLLEDPFLVIDADNFNERGLSGFVFHPDFATNNYFYLYYSVPRTRVNRVSRFTANGNYAIPSSELVIFETEEIGSIHNAGALVFGLDGRLYVSIGDLSNPNNVQSLDNSSGKIMRFEADGSIPMDNPFVDIAEGQYKAIYALGFRNSFCMTVDALTGEIYAGDVGGEDWEEINQIKKGANYGWNVGEGPVPGDSEPGRYQAPLYYYPNEWGVGCAITGIAVYNPEAKIFPEEYHNEIFFTDYCTGEIRRVSKSGEIREVFASGIVSPLALMVSKHGSLNYAERNADGTGSLADNTSSQDGRIWKVSYTGLDEPVVTISPRDQTVVPGDTARFEVDATGKDLRYTWYEGSNIVIENTQELVLPQVTLQDDGRSFHCIIKNELGESRTATATLHVVENSRPSAQIVAPQVGYTYQAGDTIYYKGIISDAEDGFLDQDAYSWNIQFHHELHFHPFLSDIHAEDGFFVVPAIGETSADVWYRIHLTATDSRGFSSTVHRDIYPDLVEIQIMSDPIGAQVNMDGATYHTPYEIESVKGILHTVQAPAFQIFNDKLLSLKNWSFDGVQGMKTDFIANSDPEIIVAEFEVGTLGSGTGLFGEYFNNTNLQENSQLEKVDEEISFHWSYGSPDTSINEDQFSIRWSGFLQAPFDGEYTFYISTADSYRLWIDDVLLIDNWQANGGLESSESITLENAYKYPIILEYREDYGDASCELTWSSTYFKQTRIPTNQLYPKRFKAVDLINKITINPIPADDLINIQILSPSLPRSLRFYDFSGRSVTEKVTIDPIDSSFQANISRLLPGVYVASFQFDDGIESVQFIVAK